MTLLYTEITDYSFIKPVNSGYSYHDNDTVHITDSNTAAQDVYVFLQLFFEEFSRKTN